MRDDDELPPELRQAVDALREAPGVRPEWIASIAERAAADRVDSIRSTHIEGRWSLDWRMAIAAGLVCVAVGAGGMYLALARRTASPRDVPLIAARAAKAPVRFAIVAPGAVTVQLVGDFNEWNPVALPMRRSSDGSTWEVEVGLLPGRYTYAFVVDGRLARDPSAAQAASDDFGVPSSVLLVKGGGT
jgi:Carbohydrate-binding module 48 (Isoamylase N-terminal domain)